MPVHVADFAPLQVFAEWHQNIPKWVGKLWKFDCENFEFWLTRSCKRR